MKKSIVTAALGLALTATGAYAQTTQVLSRNAVGYVKIDVLASNFYLASIPFNAFSNTIPGIFGAQLVGGVSPAASDVVLKFDAGAKAYITFWKTLTGEWRQFPQGVATTNTLRPGEAFFIQNKRTTNQSVFLMGEVPDAITGPTQFIGIVTSLQFASYGYPVQVPISNLTLNGVARRGVSPAASDNILTWNPSARSYQTYWFPLAGGVRLFPEGVTTSNQLAVGQGFFYNRRSNSVVWVEAKPYTWP